MRLVLDTGILISSLITTHSPPDLIYRAWQRGQYQLITCEGQIKEFSRVIQYPKLQRFIKSEEASQLLEDLTYFAELVSIDQIPNYSPDPDDNVIIACALTGRADYLISGDKRDMLSLRSFENIPIITARQALGVLDI